MKTKLISFITIGLILSFGVTFMATNTFINEELVDNGGSFAFLLVSLLIVNPIFFVVYGAILSEWLQKIWWSILLVASFFYIATMVFYSDMDGEIRQASMFYATTYAIFGYIAMFFWYYMSRKRANRPINKVDKIK